MEDRTSRTYVYWHDGGEYIGCRARGYDGDCLHQEWSKVDCRECPFNVGMNRAKPKRLKV